MDTTSSTTASSLTRRRILGWGGTGAIGGIATYIGWPRQESATVTEVNPSSVASPASQTSEMTVSQTPKPVGGFRRDDFLPHLRSTFQLDNSMSCTLIEVGAAQKLVSPTAEFISFSLLFAAPKDSVAESRIHQLTHAKMESMDLFISPVGDSKEHVYLEAICSQQA